MSIKLPWKYFQYFALFISLVVIISDYYEKDTINFIQKIGSINSWLLLISFYLIRLLRDCDTVYWNKPNYFKAFAMSKFQLFIYELKQVFLFKNFIAFIIGISVYGLLHHVWLTTMSFENCLAYSFIYVGNLLFIIVFLVFLKNLLKADLDSDFNYIILSIIPTLLLLSSFGEELEKKKDFLSKVIKYNPFSDIFYLGLVNFDTFQWYFVIFPFIATAFLFILAKILLKTWI